MDKIASDEKAQEPTDKTRINEFEPKDLTTEPPVFQLPNETWTSLLSTPCGSQPEYFVQVMDNLLRNPNVTSSHLFRAEIFYDSACDSPIFEDPSSPDLEEQSTLLRHLKAEYRPIQVTVPEYTLQRTVVRRLVPRNPELDNALVQTVHHYDFSSDSENRTLIIYVPHVESPDFMPYYHPKAQSVAFIHTINSTASPSGSLSLHYRLFPGEPLTSRLQRTALNLLKIIHKHAAGQQAGYTKRVHHDQLVPQKRFQDTYARLKSKYAKRLILDWVEVTDPVKHVFEDLGIAAFCIELWRDMYGEVVDGKESIDEASELRGASKTYQFPGFVDIGCGNGLLVYLLISEGYGGWGFDARRRKSWAMFPMDIQEKLKELILVPEILQKPSFHSGARDQRDQDAHEPQGFHNGKFPRGTFIISNHADELTPWTPLLAHLSQSPFIAIPCCSHSLTGARCRFHTSQSPSAKSANPANLKTEDNPKEEPGLNTRVHLFTSSATTGPGPASGSLARPKGNKPPSAYAGLTAYVIRLAEELGYAAQTEALRIPSTRNVAIIGQRSLGHDQGEPSDDRRTEAVRKILQRDTGNLERAGAEWIEMALKLVKGKGSGH
jgi:tRNASer (uridine44-2'-O)-methyltransferase